MFTNSLPTQEVNPYPHVLPELYTDREAIMTDSIFSNPTVVGGTVTAGLAAVTAIIVAAINKRKAPKDYQADVQRVLTESFKVLTDGYEKQIRVVMDGYEKQLRILEDKLTHYADKIERLEADKTRQSLEIDRQSKEITRLTEGSANQNDKISKQADEISRQATEISQQKTTIANLENELQRLRNRTSPYKHSGKSTGV